MHSCIKIGTCGDQLEVQLQAFSFGRKDEKIAGLLLEWILNIH